jgi:nitrile hydratase accessory protein
VDVDAEIAQATGPAALPRRNGELVFTAPWHGRAFGMAVALRQGGRFAWRDFQERLEREIGAAGPDDDASHYYEHWLAALEWLAIDRGLVDGAELSRRVEEYRSGLRDEVF